MVHHACSQRTVLFASAPEVRCLVTFSCDDVLSTFLFGGSRLVDIGTLESRQHDPDSSVLLSSLPGSSLGHTRLAPFSKALDGP